MFVSLYEHAYKYANIRGLIILEFYPYYKEMIRSVYIR